MMLGRQLAAQQRLDEALEEFDRATRHRPDAVGPATMAAMILQMQNRPAEAQTRYEAIVAQNPRAAIAANNLAWMYAERGGNLEIALQLAQAAKAELPDSAEVNHTLGWIFLKQDLPHLAIAPLEATVAISPGNARYRYHLGTAYQMAGRGDRARAEFERALQLDSRFDGADDARARLAQLGG
jgi:tetratricopeptide (TPR) repeat protein